MLEEFGMKSRGNAPAGFPKPPPTVSISCVAGRQWFAIAAIGRDRPGIVADLSECVYECACNLEDASMTMLGNEFATLMLVSGTGDDLAGRLGDATRRLEWERYLTVFLRPLDQAPEPTGTANGAAYELTATGVDKAGIVAGVTRRLADENIHITDLRGKISPVPQAGTPMYTLAIRMRTPASIDRDKLERDFTDLAETLGVEIELRETALD
jgi:glycine cleavage system transcriptional repressor